MSVSNSFRSRSFLHSFLLLTLFTCTGLAQSSEHVLFIGNSYTAYNNLPNMVAEAALSAGDTLTYSAHTPGGQTLSQHYANASAQSLIALGEWDHVVMQCQSQEPSFPSGQFSTQTQQYANLLVENIRTANACTRPMFYMTWGRENGDASNCASWPPVCTYEGMDSLLRLRYQLMADESESYVSPVGAVWRYLRDGGSATQLYASDGSHPSLAGSYAAACTFYAVIFEKDPLLITIDLGVDPAQAAEIRMAAHEIVYNDLTQWNIGAFDPVAGFTSNSIDLTIEFTDASNYADSVQWLWNDNQLSNPPTITFPGPGGYDISQVAFFCGLSDTITTTVFAGASSLEEIHTTSSFTLFPNPVRDSATITIDKRIDSIEVFDLSLKKVKLEFLIDEQSIDLSYLNSGAYFMLLHLENDEVMTSKFVKY